MTNPIYPNFFIRMLPLTQLLIISSRGQYFAGMWMRCGAYVRKWSIYSNMESFTFDFFFLYSDLTSRLNGSFPHPHVDQFFKSGYSNSRIIGVGTVKRPASKKLIIFLEFLISNSGSTIEKVKIKRKTTNQFYKKHVPTYRVVYFKSHHCSSPYGVSRRCTRIFSTCYLIDVKHFNMHH